MALFDNGGPFPSKGRLPWMGRSMPQPGLPQQSFDERFAGGDLSGFEPAALIQRFMPGANPQNASPQMPMPRPRPASAPQEPDYNHLYAGSPETNPLLRPMGTPMPWHGKPWAGFLDSMYERGGQSDAGLIPKFVNLLGRGLS